MNEEKEIERIKYQIYDLATICKTTIKQKKQFAKNEKNMKEEIRELFLLLPEENRKDKFKNDVVEVSAKFPKSFDIGLLGVELPELYKKFVSMEKVIVESERIIFDEKELKRLHPKEYEKCCVKGTIQITIK